MKTVNEYISDYNQGFITENELVSILMLGTDLELSWEEVPKRFQMDLISIYTQTSVLEMDRNTPLKSWLGIEYSPSKHNMFFKNVDFLKEFEEDGPL